MRFLYFPVTGIAGLIRPNNCHSSEVAVTGNDGAVGIDLILAGENALCRAEVISAGHAYRLNAEILSAEFRVDTMLQRLLRSYTQSMIKQIARTAACNCWHSLEERVCRWLLTCHDRTSMPQLQTTTRMIGNSLAADEQDVEAVLLHLEHKGMIETSSSEIEITDPLRLEARACECYMLINEFALSEAQSEKSRVTARRTTLPILTLIDGRFPLTAQGNA